MTMNPTPVPKRAKAKLPKARVMFTYKNARGEKCVQAHKRDLGRGPWTVLVIPCHTPALARKRARVENLSCGERVEMVAKIISPVAGFLFSQLNDSAKKHVQSKARAVLAALCLEDGT